MGADAAREPSSAGAAVAPLFAGPLAERRAPRHILCMDMRVAIRVNGEQREVAAATVAELLASLDLPAQKVAVERNLEIVPRSLYGATRLSDGDAIEIVHFIGGG